MYELSTIKAKRIIFNQDAAVSLHKINPIKVSTIYVFHNLQYTLIIKLGDYI